MYDKSIYTVYICFGKCHLVVLIINQSPTRSATMSTSDTHASVRVSYSRELESESTPTRSPIMTA